MNFLSPLALLGLLGLGLPLAAHLLGRERPEKVRFAAVRFVRPQEPVVSQRRRVRDWPLLLLRLLFFGLLVLVLARPVVGNEAAVAVLAEPHDAVIVLDASASMTLRVDGRSELERGREQIERLLDALPPGSSVGLVISDPGAPSSARAPVAEGAGQVRATLDAWFEGRSSPGPRPGPWALVEALPRAADMLAEVGRGQGEARPRVIYAVGDPTARGLGSLPGQVEGVITVIPVPTRGRAGEQPPPPPEHLGIRSLSWEPAPELDPRAVRIQGVVRRYAREPGESGESGRARRSAEALSVEVVLEIGDREVARTRVELPPASEAAIEFVHSMAEDPAASADPSTQIGARARVRLLVDDDPLPFDDRRHLWLTVGEVAEVLVINGDPSESRIDDEIFFLSTALSNSDLDERLELRGMATDQLEDRLRGSEPGVDPLAGVDVLVLANVRALAPELAPLIVEKVRAGMGLWITVGDRVSAAEYNARFGALLPLLLREAVFAGTAPGRTEARGEALAPVELSHPMFAGLEDGVELEFGSARSKRMFLLEPDPRRGADMALAFSSGAPALITREFGDGRVALLTTSVDRDWGDLPLRPGFAPLVTALASWLAGAEVDGARSSVPVGGRKVLARALPYAVSTPGGRSVPVTPVGEELAVFEANDRPGHYSASARGASQGFGVERFIVEVDEREADTSPVTVAAAQLDAEAGTVVIYTPRWRELAMLVLLLLGIESVVRWWLGRSTTQR